MEKKSGKLANSAFVHISGLFTKDKIGIYTHKV